jgi:hypothetical protein
MRTRIFVATAVAAVTGFATAGYPAQPSPGAGVYVMVAEVTSAKGDCNSQGGLVIGTFDYPGPGKKAATLHLPLINKFAIQVDAFSKTPAVGQTDWNGTFVETKLPGVGRTMGRFTATLIPVDTLSFAGEFNTDNVTTGCKLTLQALFLKTS